MLESTHLSWKPQSVSLSVQAAITGAETGWLINDRNIFLSVEAGKFKIKVLADSISGESYFLVHRLMSFCCILLLW